MVKWTLEFDGMPVYEARNAWVFKRGKKGNIVVIEGIGVLKGYHDKKGHESNLQFRIPIKLSEKLGNELIKRYRKYYWKRAKTKR